MAQGRLKWFAAIVGPAAFMAAGTMGAGSTGSFLMAGAWFRYDLLWVLVLVLPLFVISVDSASRIGLLNPEHGMFSLVRTRIHPGLAWLLIVLNAPLYLLISMSHMSVMTSALLSIAGYDPPAAGAAEYARLYKWAEFALSAACAALLVWLLSSSSYQQVQRAMTACMVFMIVCFLVVALRGFSEFGAIVAGLVPSVPDDVTGDAGVRNSFASIIAMTGSLLAPPAMLGISYMSAHDRLAPADLAREFRKSVINLGGGVGLYAASLIIAGGFVLHRLANHAEIDTVHEASQVLDRAFPAVIGFLGPIVFSMGLFMAAVTTYVVVAELMTYFVLDVARRDWHQTPQNRAFRRSLLLWIVVPALAAPFWDMPELLKVVLLMGANTVLVPLCIAVVWILVNRVDVMGEHRAGRLRNGVLAVTFVVALVMSITQLPDYLAALGV